MYVGCASRFSKRACNNNECDPSDAKIMTLFPTKGVPLGSMKTDPFILDDNPLS